MFNKGDCKAEVDSNFIATISLLNANEIEYWVCHGTLLGLVRDGSLIPWDHDVDIAMWATSDAKEKILNLMLSEDFSVLNDGADYDFLSFTKSGGREVDFNFYRVATDLDLAYSEWYIPRFVFFSFLEAASNVKSYSGKFKWLVAHISFLSPLFYRAVSLLKRGKYFYKSAGYTTPVIFLKEFTSINISGLEVRAPLQYQAVNEFIYGQDWNTPKKEYDWKRESPSTRISNTRF